MSTPAQLLHLAPQKQSKRPQHLCRHPWGLDLEANVNTFAVGSDPRIKMLERFRVANHCNTTLVHLSCFGCLQRQVTCPGPPPVLPHLNLCYKLAAETKKMSASPLNLIKSPESPWSFNIHSSIRLMIRRQLREPFLWKQWPLRKLQETPRVSTETARFVTGHHRKDLHNLTTPGCWVLFAGFILMAHGAFSFQVLVAWEGLQPPSVDMWLGLTWTCEEFTSRKSGGKTRLKTEHSKTKNKKYIHICM